MNHTLDIALEYRAAGLCVIPLRLDGSKSPAVGSWKEFQQRRPTDDEMRHGFCRPAGIGIVTGAVSLGLEVLDFDQWQVFEPWRSRVTGIIERLPVVETASGGFHVLYRCNRICGNTKIASWEPVDDRSPAAKLFPEIAATRQGCNGLPIKPTRIETRGEGGYVVAVGSPAEVHPSRKAYVQVLGPVLPEIPRITPEERKELWLAAMEFDCGKYVSANMQRAKREIKRQRWEEAAKHRPAGDVPPWDDFDSRGRWEDVLEPAGWRQVGDSKWCRPGKPFGVSASSGVNAEGIEVLTVFTSSDSLLQPGSYGKFRAYAAINHAGDGSAAARELRKLGYGSRQEVAA